MSLIMLPLDIVAARLVRAESTKAVVSDGSGRGRSLCCRGQHSGPIVVAQRLAVGEERGEAPARFGDDLPAALAATQSLHQETRLRQRDGAAAAGVTTGRHRHQRKSRLRRPQRDHVADLGTAGGIERAPQVATECVAVRATVLRYIIRISSSAAVREIFAAGPDFPCASTRITPTSVRPTKPSAARR
jgi:hypothetical protein